MAFTDKQTLEDINIFGGTADQSVYSIFDKTVSQGGRLILDEIFRNPFNNYIEIDQRVSILNFVLTNKVTFPFKEIDFDVVDLYLTNTDQRIEVSQEKNIFQLITDKLVVSKEQEIIVRGVKGIVNIIVSTGSFLNNLTEIKHDKVRNYFQKFSEFLQEESLRPLIGISSSAKLTIHQTAVLDNIFRFSQRKLIRELLETIYQLDAYISIVEVAKEKKFVFAKIAESKPTIVNVRGLIHPLLKSPLPNDVNFTHGKNVMFLTGANMAGKSTFMKSFTIALYLAHCGLPVPAAHMEFSVLDGIYTTINLADSLGNGESHFYSEILRLKKIAKLLASSKRLFVVFDELFRGTNVKDACDATVAVVKAFSEITSSNFIVSTHITEAGEILSELTPHITYKYLPTELVDGRPVYSRKLMDGISVDRYGMIIIENEKILDILKLQ